MTKTLLQFAGDESGTTAIEYGLIAGLIAVACIAAFISFGGSVNGLFGVVNSKAGNAINSAT